MLPPDLAGGAAASPIETLLDSGVATLGLAWADDAQRQRCLQFLALLQQWNRVYNLTAIRQPVEMVTHHLLDCLAVLPALRRQLGSGSPRRVLDVGSGGGLPGVLLAVMEPQWQVVCVDAVAKKAGFVRQAAAELSLPNLQALHARVQDVPARQGGFDLVISRAFASLGDFTAWTAHLLAPQGVWAAMKAQLPEADRASLGAQAEVFHVEPLQVPHLEAGRCLVWMRPAARAEAP